MVSDPPDDGEWKDPLETGGKKPLGGSGTLYGAISGKDNVFGGLPNGLWRLS